MLVPCDLQAVKAAGVTFAGAMIERVIEERARGVPARAEAIRQELAQRLGGCAAAQAQQHEERC